MSERAKRIFLAICIVVPFLLYCFYYYSIMIKNAPYRFADFQSVVFKYGEGESLINQFDSATGYYLYVNARDSLISDTLRLRKDDLLYLHRKAAELGFWNLPDDMTTPIDTAAEPVPRFFLQFNYKEKSKEVTLDADFNSGNPKMLEAAKSVIDEVRRVLSDAHDR